MKKRTNPKISSPASQVKPDTTELLIKMQQHLVLLEKKIDNLLNQASQRPPEAKPLQHFKLSHSRPQAPYGGNRSARTMFKAICADCNNECEVPFRPTQGRPVYCQQCFSKRKRGLPTEKSGSFKPSHYDRPRRREITPQHPFKKYMGSRKHSPAQNPAFKKRKR